MPRLFGRTIEAIVLDKDGVLLDFQARWGAVVEARIAALAHQAPPGLAPGAFRALAAAEFGWDPEAGRAAPEGLLASGTRAEAEALAAGLLRRLGRASWSDCRARAARAFEEAEARCAARRTERPIPGASQAVRALHARGFRLALATTDRQEAAWRHLRAEGLQDCFEAVVGSDSGPAVKPAPDALLAIARTLALDVARLAMVGDAPVDLAMARAAGAGLALAVGTGLGDAESLAGADRFLPDLAALALSAGR